MIEVKNRSEESWGPLAKCDDVYFQKLINGRQDSTKDRIKDHIKKQKKLKKYKVTFIREEISEPVEIEAASDWDVSSAAAGYFHNHAESITFKTKERGKWAGDYKGYDKVSYRKI